jgi:hypothetical protein
MLPVVPPADSCSAFTTTYTQLLQAYLDQNVRVLEAITIDYIRYVIGHNVGDTLAYVLILWCKLQEYFKLLCDQFCPLQAAFVEERHKYYNYHHTPQTFSALTRYDQ